MIKIIINSKKQEKLMDKKSRNMILYRFFPFIEWMKDYQSSYLQKDAISGITVAVVLIPQSMAYAMLAGLPPVYGLYAAAITPFIASMWGSLRQLATGPIAIMSLLVLTSLTPIAEPGSEEFIKLAFLLAFMVGVIYMLIGIFQMGLIMSFISHSAVRGFTAAAALIIISTQLPNLLGITIGRHEYVILSFWDILKNLSGFHLYTFIIGLLAIIIIFGVKKYKPTLPGGLFAIIITSILVKLIGLQDKGVAVVGFVPGGLSGFNMPEFSVGIMSNLVGPAVVIALVSFAETYSVGKAISAETKQKLDVDQEFIGQGLANIVGSFFQSFPVSGSFSRTAISFATGAKTGVSAIISCIAVVIALLFLTPILAYIPKAALAALVISAVLLLFNPKEVFKLWNMNRHDGIVAVTVFILSLLTKPDYALLIGVVMSLMFFLWKTMRPRIVKMTKDPEFNMFVDADLTKKPGCPQILQLRSDNSIYFANAEYTVEQILERLDESETPIKYLLLDFHSMAFIDITGIEELRSLKEELDSRGIDLAVMNVHLPVMMVFESTGFSEEVTHDLIFKERGGAIINLFKLLNHEYCKNECPHALFHECKTVK